jgi:hypothetical protein
MPRRTGWECYDHLGLCMDSESWRGIEFDLGYPVPRRLRNRFLATVVLDETIMRRYCDGHEA